MLLGYQPISLNGQREFPLSGDMEQVLNDICSSVEYEWAIGPVAATTFYDCLWDRLYVLSYTKVSLN